MAVSATERLLSSSDSCKWQAGNDKVHTHTARFHGLRFGLGSFIGRSRSNQTSPPRSSRSPSSPRRKQALSSFQQPSRGTKADVPSAGYSSRSNVDAISRELFASEACSSNHSAPDSRQPPRGGSSVGSRTNNPKRNEGLSQLRNTLRVGFSNLRFGSSPQLELMAKRLLSGAFAGVVSRTAVAPLDVAKLKFMLATPAGSGAGVNVLSILRNTVRSLPSGENRT